MEAKQGSREKNNEASGFDINDENYFKKEKDKGRSFSSSQNIENSRGKKEGWMPKEKSKL